MLIKKRNLLTDYFELLTDFICCFRVSAADWVRYFKIRTTVVFVLYLFQQINICSKSATKTLEITEDNPKESIPG